WRGEFADLVRQAAVFTSLIVPPKCLTDQRELFMGPGVGWPDVDRLLPGRGRGTEVAPPLSALREQPPDIGVAIESSQLFQKGLGAAPLLIVHECPTEGPQSSLPRLRV